MGQRLSLAFGFTRSFSFLFPLQCEDVVSGLSSPLATLGELKPSQQQDLTDFLCLVGYRVQGGCPGLEDAVSNQKLFSTGYFLVSALAGTEKERNAVVTLKLLCLLEDLIHGRIGT